MQRAQRLDYHEIAALHVRYAAAICAVALAAKGLLFENRVQMADQEQALAAAASMHGHQMTRARHRRGQFRPAGLETERLELTCVDGADTTHTGEVLGCALDIDGLLEEIDGGCAVRVDCGDDALFLAAQVAARRRSEK